MAVLCSQRGRIGAPSRWSVSSKIGQMDRRSFVHAAVAGASAAALSSAAEVKPIERKGRLKQSVCRWCYSKVPIEDFCKESARLGLKSVDLATAAEWPTIQKYGLVPTMISGGT